MTAEEHNLILEHLRAIRKDIGGLKDDNREFKMRLASIETKLANMQSDGVLYTHRIDRIEERLERIENRLELYDPQRQH